MVEELSELQRLVYDNLIKQNAKLGRMYLGALRALNDNSNPERISQAAHSIREISSVLTRKIEVKLEKQDPEKKETHKKKLMRIADPRGTLPDHLHQPYEEWAGLHNWFTRVSHHEEGDGPSEDEFRKKLERWERIVSYLLRPHFGIIQEIDELLARDVITTEDSTRLRILLSRNSEAYRYFFEKASDTWLTLLVEENFFSKPPKPIHRDNLTYYEFWPESRYLARISERRPEEVADIIVKCVYAMSRSDINPRVLDDFLTAATRMPTGPARAIAKLAVKRKWRFSSLFAATLNDKTIELVLKFADGNDPATSIDLLHSLLDVTVYSLGNGLSHHDVVGVIGEYEYEAALNDTIPKLFEKYPIEIVELLISLLKKTIFLYNKALGNPVSNEDTSTVWRPAIENSDQNWTVPATRDFLVTWLRDLIVRLGNENNELLVKIMQLLDKEPYPIFRRLEVHTYRMFPERFRKEIRDVCISKFNDYDVYHEYYMLIGEQFHTLDSEAKAEILSMIDKGPDVDFYVRRRTEIDGQGPTQNTIDRYVLHWKAEAVRPILPHLNEEWKDRNKEVVDVAERLEWSGYHAYHWAGTGESEEAKISETMAPNDVISFMKSYTPTGLFNGLDDSTARKFQELVSQNPTEYSKRALELKDANWIIIYELLSGLTSGLERGVKIEWEPVLTLCSYLVRYDNKDDIKQNDHVPKTIGRLFQRGLTKSKTGIPFSERERVWTTVDALHSRKYTDGDWEDRYPESEKDAYFIAINSTTGNVMHALISYAIWCHSHLGGNDGLAAEAKKAIEAHLDLSKDNSVSTRSVLGNFFPYLATIDEQWTQARIDLIFPSGNKTLTDATWETYLHNHVFAIPFKMLMPEYRRRLKILADELKDGELRESERLFIDHVVIGHIFDMEGGDELYSEFTARATPVMLDQAINYVWHTLKDRQKESKSGINLEKIKGMWLSEKLQPRAELTEWFEYSPFERRFSISALLANLRKTGQKGEHIYRVAEPLAAYAREFPIETLECLELLISLRSEDWEIHFMRDHIRRIITEAKSSGHREITVRCNSLINNLGSLGYGEFRDLLD